MVLKIAPLGQEPEGRRLGSIAVEPRRTSNATQSVAIQAPVDKGRSCNYPCWYRVGAIGRDAVYWHPMLGMAREKDFSYLVELSALSEVVYDIDARLIRDVYESGGRILEAMGVELREAIIEDIRYAAAAAAELANAYVQSRGVEASGIALVRTVIF